MKNNFFPMLEKLPTVINNYTFLDIIGAGSYSVVYTVKSHKYNQVFAAKVSLIDSSVVAENGDIVDAEFNALTDLDHPNIIRVFDKFFCEDYFIIILEYFPGGTIQDMVNAGKSFSVRQIQNIGHDILDGLSLCHTKGFAHRDIKPSNIFVDAYGRPKLADFNLCSWLKPHQLVDQPCGTLAYVAFEVLKEEAYDPFKTDIFALGVTFYQMTFGKLPWSDDEIRSGNRKDPVFDSIVDLALVSLIKKMLDINPQNRPSALMLRDSQFFADGHTPIPLAHCMNPHEKILSVGSKGSFIPCLHKPVALKLSSKILIPRAGQVARQRRGSISGNCRLPKL